MNIDHETIKNNLPHREPFLFVDAVSSFDEGKSISASFFLSKDLPFFKGHFPEKPIMPGVLIAEALAQASGLIVSLSKMSEGGIFYLASTNIKFIEVVEPECDLILKSQLERGFSGLYQFSVEAQVRGKTVAKGSLVLASPKKSVL